MSAVQRLACSHYCFSKAAFTPPSLFVGQDAVTVLALTRLLAAFSPNSSNSVLPSPHMSSVLLFFLLLRHLTRNKNVHVSSAATAKQTSALLQRSIHVNSFIHHSLQLLRESEVTPESLLSDHMFLPTMTYRQRQRRWWWWCSRLNISGSRWGDETWRILLLPSEVQHVLLKSPRGFLKTSPEIHLSRATMMHERLQTGAT